MTPWYAQPAAQKLIETLHRLDDLAAGLEPFADKIAIHDPAAVIGQFCEEPTRFGLAHDFARAWQTNGGSATEACMGALDQLRSDWVASNGGDDIELETPSVDDAINLWRRQQMRRAA